MIISPQEEYLLKVLREAKPYESVQITKDKDGKPDRYLIQRSQKIMVSEIRIEEIK